ncbi:hypothetical protein BDW74DRAFT_160165 [Aspergillus multicolor]|uniref:uncharacterized protein n=1 Tax=Aspergillus multicolor TaxID=41759 RepID=UPI003CCD64B5
MNKNPPEAKQSRKGMVKTLIILVGVACVWSTRKDAGLWQLQKGCNCAIDRLHRYDPGCSDPKPTSHICRISWQRPFIHTPVIRLKLCRLG